MHFLPLLLPFFISLVACFSPTVAHEKADNNVTTICGMSDSSPELMKRIVNISQKKNARIGTPRPNVTIDTYFCVVTDEWGNFNVGDSMLEAQVSVLNTSFANSGSRIQFRYKGAKRFAQREANNTAMENYVDQLGLSCRQGSLSSLNIFVVPFINAPVAIGLTVGMTIGTALPYFTTSVDYTDGVFIMATTLPNGGFDKGDLGLNAVHEVGHWLGLLHTFHVLPPYEDNQCNPNNPNDYIADTPRQKNPSIGLCAPRVDSCPKDPGLDPTNNFMDYGYDYDPISKRQCRTMFTAQQVARMEDVWYYYRVQNDICTSGELQFGLQIRFDSKPVETSWDIKLFNGTVIHQSLFDQFGTGYPSQFAEKVINIHVCLSRVGYFFTIYDASGSGISPPGYYSLSVDGQLVAKGGQDFTYSKSIPFGSDPTFKPTPVPTPPAARPTPVPMTPAAKPTTVPLLSPVAKPTLVPNLPVALPAPILPRPPPFSFNSIPTSTPTISVTYTFSPTMPTPTPTTTTVPTPTREPTSAPTSTSIRIRIPSGYCLSAVNTVEVKGKGTIAIKDLHIGDMVKDADGKMVKVYSFGHYSKTVKVVYLQIFVYGFLEPLEISNDHLVFVDGNAIPASLLSIRDKVDLGGNRGFAEVVDIKFVERNGAFAPFTTSGTLLVSGLAVSSYVTLQQGSSVLVLGTFKTSLSMHWLCHIFITPHRVFCQLRNEGCDKTYNPDGISSYVEGPLHFAQWALRRQQGTFSTLIFAPALCVAILFHAVEVACIHYGCTRLLFLLVVLLLSVRMHARTTRRIDVQ